MPCPMSLVRYKVIPEADTIPLRQIVVGLNLQPTATSMRGVPKSRLDPRLHGYEDTPGSNAGNRAHERAPFLSVEATPG